MKPCPSSTCGNMIPAHYLEHMTCFMCLFFGLPQVRRAPEMKLIRVHRQRERRQEWIGDLAPRA
jgi:hypothetical protein